MAKNRLLDITGAVESVAVVTMDTRTAVAADIVEALGVHVTFVDV